MVSTLLTLDIRRQCDQVALNACIAKWLRGIRQGHLPGLSWLTGLLDDAVQSAAPEFFVRFAYVSQVAADVVRGASEIGADGFDLDQVVLSEFLRIAIMEWPGRWLALPNSRRFATRLSNWDITEIVLSSPLIAGRYWQGMWRDSIERYTVGANSQKCFVNNLLN